MVSGGAVRGRGAGAGRDVHACLRVRLRYQEPLQLILTGVFFTPILDSLNNEIRSYADALFVAIT